MTQKWGNRLIEIYPEIITIMKLAKKDIKRAIINMTHVFKKVKGNISIITREIKALK